VDDDRLISAGAVDFLHAEAVPMQPSFGLRGAQIHIEAIAFEFFHFGHCRSVWPDVSSSLQTPPMAKSSGSLLGGYQGSENKCREADIRDAGKQEFSVCTPPTLFIKDPIDTENQF
jgi:hypothetical protein